MGCNKYLHIGDVLGAHGLKGALIVYSHTRPADAVAGYSCWWLGETSEAATAYTLKRCWQHGRRILAEIEGISDCQSAEALKGQKVWIPTDEVETGEDEYLWEDLIGCRVLQRGDDLLGTVIALEEYGAQDNLLVRTAPGAQQQGEWLIPFTGQMIVEVDLDKGVIVVDMPEGMDACFTPRF
ncbi:MAG: ribosome maturation factor RimM [Mariprofundus sp.]